MKTKFIETIRQRDPVAMRTYALGITERKTMMDELVTTKHNDTKMIAFADHFRDAGKLKSLL